MKNYLKTWNSRPFPNSLTSLRSVRTSWSQFGEDLLLSHIFGPYRTAGFYVDVGCFHPIRYSNTYLFYRRNWRGICIDPSPVTARLWKKYRPGDTVVTKAVAGVPGTAHYFEFDACPEYNRLLDTPELPDVRETGPPSRVSEIPVMPLAEILHREVPPENSIDLLSIDCEGMDLEVLKSADLKRFRPKALVIEDHDLASNTATTRFVESFGFEKVAQALVSKIFVDPSLPLPFRSVELQS